MRFFTVSTVVGVLAAQAAYADSADLPVAALLLSKLHPAFVHFPIGLILAVAILEVIQVIRRQPPSAASFPCLVLALLGSILAGVSGWFYAGSHEYQGEIATVVEDHRWIAIAGSLLALEAFVALNLRALLAFRVGIVLAAATIGYAAHLGGQLVHGIDYLSKVFAAKEVPATQEVRALRSASFASDESQTVVPPPSRRKISFAKDVHPLLETHCARCHMDGHDKGEFRMDSRELVLKGGETGDSVVVGESSKSYLIDLVSGVNPKKVMPSKGRRLTEEEIGILRAWIDQGLAWETAERKRKLTPKVSPLLTRPEIPTTSTAAHPIDRIVLEYLAGHSVPSPQPVSDEVFVQRAFLDLVGYRPQQRDVLSYQKDSDPNKKQKLIRSLLARRGDVAAHWLTFWNDLLRNDYSGPGFLHGERRDDSRWLYASLYRNESYKQFATNLIAPRTGKNDAFINGIKWWTKGNVTANEEPEMQAAQNVAQIFMGVNLKCASCHNSFTDEWKLDEAYAFANIFARRQLVTHECNVPTGEKARPAFLYPELGEIDVRGSVRRRQQSLAAVLTSEQNGRFARTFVNRVWAKLFGAGIVPTVDELDNSPWSQTLLDWLAAEFVAQGYDVAKLLELIMTSDAYSFPVVPTVESASVGHTFRGPVTRRISVEQYLDSVSRSFDTVTPAAAPDVERLFGVSLYNAELAEARDALRGHVRFTSGKIGVSKDAIPFEASVRGASHAWLVVFRRYAQKSALDLQREQFDAVNKKDQGLEPVEVRSAQSSRDHASRVAKGRKPKARSHSYEVHLGDVVLKGASGLKPLTTYHNIQQWMETPPVVAVLGEAQDTVANLPRFEGNTYVTRAFSAIYLPLRGEETISGSVRVVSDPSSEVHVEFAVITDLPFRSVFLEATPTLLALGRPRREQIQTTRASLPTTMQALEVSTGKDIDTLMQRAARSLVPPDKTLPTKELTRLVFRNLLARSPTPDEASIIVQEVGDTMSTDEVADLIWNLSVLPEFQLIR